MFGVNSNWQAANSEKMILPYDQGLKPQANTPMKSHRQEWLRSGYLRYGHTFSKLKHSKRRFRNTHRKAVQKYILKLYDDIDHRT